MRAGRHAGAVNALLAMLSGAPRLETPGHKGYPLRHAAKGRGSALQCTQAGGRKTDAGIGALCACWCVHICKSYATAHSSDLKTRLEFCRHAECRKS